MNFVALDFETANERRDSACALGLVVVSDGIVAQQFEWLICPPEPRFSALNVALHGIREQDVIGKPTFADIWLNVKGLLECSPVVAHNASFDAGVLAHTLAAYGLCPPELDWYCTKQIARAVWPGLPTYNLAHLAEVFNLQLTHHNAVHDALACAQIARNACDNIGVTTLNELALRISCRQAINLTASTEKSTGSRRRRNTVSARDITPTCDGIRPRAMISGYAFAFTGELISMARQAAMQVVVNAGGTCTDNVSKRTNYLVVGGLYTQEFKNGYKTGKMKRAIELIEGGSSLEIITEDDFCEMLET